MPKFTGTLKQGDRVPPGGTFDYHWNTLGWPTTAGVWLYHDHSICDAENVGLGAIGIIVIHNPADPEDVLAPDVPPFGSPVQIRCFPLPFDVPILRRAFPDWRPPDGQDGSQPRLHDQQWVHLTRGGQR